MDSVDVKIIECLKANSRENASVIGSKVNMSVSAVIERIKKLEASGIIKQYTVVLDNDKLGLDLTAFISVSMEHPKYNDGFVEFVMCHPQIVECHYITGDFDFLLKICNRFLQSFFKLYLRFPPCQLFFCQTYIRFALFRIITWQRTKNNFRF